MKVKGLFAAGTKAEEHPAVAKRARVTIVLLFVMV
jgi:hypothetical protein